MLRVQADEILRKPSQSSLIDLIVPQTKECQIAAWKAHKEACKATQQTMQRISEDGLSDQIALLRNWTSKHRPVLGQAALVALDLAIEPSRAKKYFLLVQLTRRAMYDRTERAYDVDDVSVMPLVSRDEDPNEGFLPPHVVDTLRQTLEDSPNTCLCPGRKKHKTGKYFVILSSGLGTVPNVVPFAYCEAVLKATTPGSYWKEGLIAKLSEGVVS